jgi:hypothetical protein
VRGRVILAILALAASGCAEAPEVARMVPTLEPRPAIAAPKSLRVGEVHGGQKTNPMVTSTIEDEGFREALVKTLRESGLFREVESAPAAEYALSAQILGQQLQPGATVVTVLLVRYELVEVAASRSVWTDNILSQYQAEFDVAFAAAERARRANEGAVRENLRQLVGHLARVLASTP